MIRMNRIQPQTPNTTGHRLLVWACLLLAGCSFGHIQVAHHTSSPAASPPRLHFDESVAPDLRTLASETWSVFVAVFEARIDCFGDVYLRAHSDLSARASYDPATSTVTVRVPGTPAFLQGALVHEWAHHIEFQCEAHQDLRPAFLAALGLPPDTPWHTAHVWEDIPSEHYAEAAVELVTGHHPLPTKLRTKRDAVDVLAAWAKRR